MPHPRRPNSSSSIALPARKTSHAFTYHPRALHTPTSIIHLEYDPANVPPKPGPEWTRFVCISDTHSRIFEVPEGDVLLHTGDLTNTGLVQEFRKTVDWLKGLRHRKKIIIAGNHDLSLHSGWYEQNFPRWHGHGDMQDRNAIMRFLQGPEATAAGLVYLQDEEYTFQVKEGGRRWSVYGSPWTPDFYNWAFNYTSSQAGSLVSRIPRTDILLTHGPPYQMHDLTYTGSVVGCPALRKRIAHLRPRLHVAGHIHESRGGCVWAWPDRLHFASSPPCTSPSNTSPHSSGPNTPAEYTMQDYTSSASMPWEADGELVVGNTNILNYAATNKNRDGGMDVVEEDEGEGEVGGGGGGKEQTVFVNASNAPSGKYAWREDVKVPFGGPGFQAVIVDLKD